MNEATNNYTVYKHTTPAGKVYIGITSRSVYDRWQNGNGYKANSYFYNAIQKYGWDNIKHDIIADHLTKEEACDLEMKLISDYDSTNHERGYNHSVGGEHGGLGMTALRGYKHSDETRKKIRDAMIKRNNTEEGQKMIASRKKAVMCVQTNIVYESVADAARAYNTTGCIISKICHNLQHTLRGYYSFVFV